MHAGVKGGRLLLTGATHASTDVLNDGTMLLKLTPAPKQIEPLVLGTLRESSRSYQI